MSFQAELKRIRQRCFLSQQAFAKEINVAFSTVNRWESGKAKPNLAAMKSIKEFCSRTMWITLPRRTLVGSGIGGKAA